MASARTVDTMPGWSAISASTAPVQGPRLLALSILASLAVIAARSASVTSLAIRTFDGILSRRRSGVAWWRFGARVISPTADAEATNGDPAPDSGHTLDSGLATVLDDAKALSLVERIRNARFSTTRLSAGYDEQEVDMFLDKLIAIFSDGGQPDQAELGNVRFTATRLRPGYVMQDVDSFLDE